MPAIQNQINLYVNANGQLVPGSEPSDVLYRNNINRNVFFVITPLSQASVVKMIFRNTSLARQGYTGIAFVTNQKGSNITSEEVSYYELVKDWSVFKFVPNSTILTKFPSSISGSIGLTVSIKEPDLSDKTQWTFKDNLLDANYDYSTIEPREYVRCLASSLVVPTFGTIYSGDCIVNVPDKGLTLIRLLWTRSTTEPLLFVGNPALEDADFEDAEIGDASLLDSVVSMQNQQTQAIVDVNDRLDNLINILLDGVDRTYVGTDTPDLIAYNQWYDTSITVEEDNSPLETDESLVTLFTFDEPEIEETKEGEEFELNSEYDDNGNYKGE